MNERLQELFDIIVRTQHPLTIAALAEQLGVSSRTVRNGIQSINPMLAKLGYEEIRVQRGVVSIRAESIVEYKDKLLTIQNVRYAANNRHLWIEVPLLCSGTYLTLAALCEWMDLSRSTVINSLEKVRSDLKSAGLTLQSLQKHGFIVVGDELQIRDRAVHLIAALFFDNENNDAIATECERILDASSSGGTVWADCLQTASLIEKALGEAWTDESYRRVAAAIYVTALRSGESPRLKEADRRLIMSTRDYYMLKELLDADIPAFRFLCKEDICFVVRYILTVVCMNVSYYKKENQVRISIVASKILSLAYDAENASGKLYDALHEQLCEYLSHAYYRMKLKCNMDLMPLENGWQENRNDAIRKVMEDFFGAMPPDNELWFVNALLDGKRMMDMTLDTGKYHAVLMTDRDIISSMELKRDVEKLDERIAVMEVHPLHKAKEIHFGEYDIVVGTKPTDLPRWRSVFIVDNGENWRTALLAYIAGTPPKKTKSTPLADKTAHTLLKIIEESTDQNTFRRICNRISMELGPDFFQKGNSMLKDILKPETILLNAHADTWQEAVECSGRLMLNVGCIEERFIESMLDMVRENGPYVVIAPGIAMPHARPESGAIRTCMSLVTLDTPIEFGNSENDPVYLVIGLAATDNCSHLDALSELVDILGDKEKYDLILNAKTADAIRALFK